MNRNDNGAPFPMPSLGGRFGRPWLSSKMANPLQQQALPGASQMSNAGASFGTAARAKASHTFTPGARPMASTQMNPGTFITPWSQPSQPDFDHQAGYAPPLNFEASQPAPHFGGSAATEMITQSQPSQVAAKLLEELQGKPSTPANDETVPLLRDIMKKLNQLEENHNIFAEAVQNVESAFHAQASQAPHNGASSSVEQQLKKIFTTLDTFVPTTESMQQALDSMKSAKKRPVMAEIATQTSPALAPHRPAATTGHTADIVPKSSIVGDCQPLVSAAAAKITKKPAAVGKQVPRLFASLVGQKRTIDHVASSDEEEEDPVQFRLARRMKRFNRSQLQSQKRPPQDGRS